MSIDNHDHLHGAIDELLKAALKRSPDIVQPLVRMAVVAPTERGVDLAVRTLVGPDHELGDRVRPAIGAALAEGPAGVRAVAAALVGRWTDITGVVPRWVEEL